MKKEKNLENSTCCAKYMEEEKTPMEQLIDKINLYDERGGINIFTLKSVLQSYLKLETEYLEKLKKS
jgi:hypothetical protein